VTHLAEIFYRFQIRAKICSHVSTKQLIVTGVSKFSNSSWYEDERNVVSYNSSKLFELPRPSLTASEKRLWNTKPKERQRPRLPSLQRKSYFQNWLKPAKETAFSHRPRYPLWVTCLAPGNVKQSDLITDAGRRRDVIKRASNARRMQQTMM